MIKRVTHAHLGPIWYHSEPSDVPYSPNQFLGWDFFCRFLQQDGSSLWNLLIKGPTKNMVYSDLEGLLFGEVCKTSVKIYDECRKPFKMSKKQNFRIFSFKKYGTYCTVLPKSKDIETKAALSVRKQLT